MFKKIIIMSERSGNIKVKHHDMTALLSRTLYTTFRVLYSPLYQAAMQASVGRFDRQVQCLISSWQFPSRLEPSPDVGPVFPDRRGKPPSRTKT